MDLLAWYDGDARMRYDGTAAGARHDNGRRAGLAAFAALAFAVRAGLLSPRNDEAPATAIGDLLADLRHLADSLGLDYADLDTRGEDHYRHELRG
ncbi:hypothetical protein [Pseudonocardia kunmingensis]|nr:hypothetical protein [Pseudonocardia kunmingensis]